MVLASASAMRPACDHLIVVVRVAHKGLADMPYITTASHLLVARTIDAAIRNAVAQYLDQRGHPVAFSRHWFRPLSQLTGDKGARDFLVKNQKHVDFVLVDAGVLDDVTPRPHRTRFRSCYFYTQEGKVQPISFRPKREAHTFKTTLTIKRNINHHHRERS